MSSLIILESVSYFLMDFRLLCNFIDIPFTLFVLACAVLTRQFVAHEGKLLSFLRSNFTGGLIILTDKIPKNSHICVQAYLQHVTVGDELVDSKSKLMYEVCVSFTRQLASFFSFSFSFQSSKEVLLNSFAV